MAHRAHSDIIRLARLLAGALIVTLIASTVAGCMRAKTPHTAAEAAPARQEQTGVRFLRADLVDVAAFVADRVDKGFVLTDPSLRTLPLTMYQPGETSAEQLEEMFLVLLESHGLSVVDRNGYWIISRSNEMMRVRAAGGEVSTEGTVVLDFRQAPLSDATGFISQATGKRFIVTGGAGARPTTIQALQPISPADAYALFITALRADGLRVDENGDTITITWRPSYAVPDPDQGAHKK